MVKVGCIHIHDVRIPELARFGSDVTLVCRHDVIMDHLYAQKWFKGSNEFYRYTPSNNPQVQIYPVPGVHVNVSNNAQIQIYIMLLEYKSM